MQLPNRTIAQSCTPLEVSKDLGRLLTTDEAAQILNVSARTLDRYRVTGEGPKYVTLSPRAIRYRYDELVDWINGRSRTSTSDQGNGGAQ